MVSAPDFPDYLKVSAAQNNLRIIAPSRPGYGKSDTVPATQLELVRQTARDLNALLDILSIPTAFVIGNIVASGYALNFADRFSNRCLAVLAAGFSGLVNERFVENLSPMSRVFARSAERPGPALRFLTRAAISVIDFLGSERMAHRFYKDSQVDWESIQKMGCLEMMAEGFAHSFARVATRLSRIFT